MEHQHQAMAAKPIKRIGAAIAAMGMALALACSLSGCMKTGANADVEKSLAECLEPLTTADGSAIGTVKNNLDAEDLLTEDFLTDYGISSDDVAASWLDGFEYKVNEVETSEDGNRATAKVTVTYRPLVTATIAAIPRTDEQMARFMDSFTDDGGDSQDTDGLSSYTGAYIVEHIKDLDLRTYDATLELDKTDEGWQLDTSTDGYLGLMSALLGDADEAAGLMRQAAGHQSGAAAE